jgi:periplasmic divalent cation tolerance protein
MEAWPRRDPRADANAGPRIGAGAGQALLDARLAACVSVGGGFTLSLARRIETAQEVPVAIKTQAARYAAVEALIVARHPYELPEIVAVPFTMACRIWRKPPKPACLSPAPAAGGRGAPRRPSQTVSSRYRALPLAAQSDLLPNERVRVQRPRERRTIIRFVIADGYYLTATAQIHAEPDRRWLSLPPGRSGRRVFASRTYRVSSSSSSPTLPRPADR